MIVRVQSSGQYRLSDDQVAHLQDLDVQLVKAVDNNDEAAMHTLLTSVVDFVQVNGQALAVDELLLSELILPSPDSTLEEVRSTLREDGLIPG